MFKSFFADRRWLHWSILGTLLILAVTWYKVQVDVRINEWVGDFYDTLQQALAKPGSITLDAYLAKCLTFVNIVLVYIVIVVLLEFFVRHYVFRWRTAMNDYYMAHWAKLRHIEGAAQRVQEDTMRFARIVEGLGVAFMNAVMSLIAFLPLLWALSAHVTELPWIGKLDHSLIYVSLVSAAGGTALLALAGFRLPGLEFNNQRVEAALRKELVYGEDHADRARPETVRELFLRVRENYFILFRNYLYFDLAKWSYLQFAVIIPFLVMGPTVVAGAITLGVLQQIMRAFEVVSSSLQFLVYSWGTIVELLSIYKRLKAFESRIDAPDVAPAAA